MGKVSRILALAGLALLTISFLPWPAAGEDTSVAPAARAEGDLAAQGAALFRAKGCVACHRHDAVDPGAPTIGPILTDYEADPAFLQRWLRDPAAVRPGTTMPNLQLQPAEIDALIAFLQSGGEATQSGTAPEVTFLIDLGEQAREIARAEMADPVLRQMVTDLDSTGFLFTDQAATREVDVSVYDPGTPLEPVEAAILWDADKLSKLGVQTIVYNMAAPYAHGQTLAERRREFVRFAREVLRHTVQSMNTEPARRMAQRRHDEMMAALAVWEREEEEQTL